MKSLTVFLLVLCSALVHAQGLETKIQTGHSSRVNDYDVSTDGNLIFTAGYDRKILMTDIRAGRELRVFAGHNLAISSLDLSNDNKKLVSGGYDQQIILWDVSTGKQVKVLKGHDEAVTSVGFSPDDKWIVSGGEKVMVWDIISGAVLKTLIDPKNIFTGFSGINKVLFSTDGKHIIAKYSTGNVLVWDAQSGELKQRIEIPISNEARLSVLTMPNDTESEADRIKIHSGTFERTPTWGSSSSDGVKTMSKYTTMQDGKVTMPLLKSYNFTDEREGYDNGNSSICLIPTTTYFFAGRSKPELFDYEKGIKYDLTIEGEGHSSPIRRISISDGAVYIMTASKNESILWKTDWEKSTIKQIRVLSNEGIWYSIFPGSGNCIRTTESGVLDITKDLFTQVFSLTKNAYPVKALALSPDGTRFSLGVQTDNTIHTWDLLKMKEIDMTGTDPEGFKEVSNLAYTPDGKFLVATIDNEPDYVGWNETSGKGKLFVFDVATRGVVVQTEIETGAPVLAISNDSRKVAIGTRAAGLSEEGGRIIVIDLIEKKMTGNYIGYSNISGLSFSPDSKRLALSDYWDANIDVKKIQGRLGIIDLEQKKEIAGPYFVPDELGLYSVSYSPDGKQLAVGGYKDVFVFDAATGTVLKTLKGHSLRINSVRYSKDGKYLVTASNDRTSMLFDLLTAKAVQSFKGHSSTVTNALFHPAKPLIFTSSLDGSVKIWNQTTGEQIASCVSMLIRRRDPEGNTTFLDGSVVVTPDNYYSCNRPAYDGIHFVKNNKYFNFMNFDMQFNRPDIILKRVGLVPTREVEMYKKAHDKRIAKMGFTDLSFAADANLPEIKLTPPQEATTQSELLSFNMEASDAKYFLKSVHVYINGVPISNRKGIDISAKKTMKHAQPIEVKLSEGKNNIEVSVFNEKGVESIIETFSIVYQPAAPKKNNLYILAIGAGKYTDQTKNLTYPVKDAKDLVTAFMSNKSKYANVVTEVLENENVTREKVLALKEKIKNTNPDDEVILFYAGHGVLNSSLNYYLGTYNINFTTPQVAGLAYEDLENILDGIPARKKLLLVDACHSGEIDKAEVVAVQSSVKQTGTIKFRDVGNTTVANVGLENSFELMKELFADLRRGSGSSVISAAGGGEFALESSEWNNGVFTYVLMEGLTKRKADANKDGKVYLSELLQYSQGEVTRLTDGKQKPTSRAENISNDWVVY